VDAVPAAVHRGELDGQAVLGELPCYALELAGKVGAQPGLLRAALEYTRGTPRVHHRSMTGQRARPPPLDIRNANAIQ
jgi:hypothetical protein